MTRRFPLVAKGVVFDLDGTLLDTLPDLARAVNLMLAELGREPLNPREVRSFIGDGAARLVKRALTGDWEAEPDADLFAQAMPLFFRHYGEGVARDSRPFPGVMEGLETLRGRGFPMACVTNKPETFTVPLLRDTGLLPYFELVVSGDTLPRKKPDPMQMTYACGHFRARPAEVVLIGDSGNDCIAAQAAGCPAFGVTYGYTPSGDVRSLGFDAIVGTVAEAAHLIRKS